jgi:hypothetical protein
MQIHLEKSKFPYTGKELRPHFLLSRFRLQGDALAAWCGACLVETDDLVDWEDRLANDHIRAGEMIHVIGEFFERTLREGVLFQRLLVATIQEELRARGVPVRRQGDDLFVAERKLSVSIVTSSPVSQLLHLGINIDPEGAPVAAIGLKELGVEPFSFIQEILGRAKQEWEDLTWACAKVKPMV